MAALLVAALTAGWATRSDLWTGPLATLGGDQVVPSTGIAGVAHTLPAKQAHRSGRGTAGGDDLGWSVAAAARRYLDTAPQGFRNDCSGFVEAATHRAGAPLRGSTRQIWQASIARGWVHHRRRPRIGDLAFFDDTWDRNGNGRADDDLTHIAIVIDVQPDGTIVMAHAGSSRGRSTLRMNLFRPGVTAADDRTLNDHLRRASAGRAPVPTLAGELWRGFATLGNEAVAL